jgi:hypothetical protein
VRKNPHLIEFSAWPWLERLSSRGGRVITLGDVPAGEWDRIASQGFDIVYLMGVWRRSPTARLMGRTDVNLLRAYDRALPGWAMQDVPGSPFSVQAYEPDARMGGWKGLDHARNELARRGVSLILDFVPNHTALDHEWVTSRPDLYIEGTLDDYRRSPGLFQPIDVGSSVHFVACGRDPYFPPWRDVAQLNYFNPATRDAMIGVLESIAQHCDGVRCDMAMLVLNEIFAGTWRDTADLLWPAPADEFWPHATARVPSLTYVAEVYWDREWQMQQQGFHFTYDKGLLDRLVKRSPGEIRGHLHADPAYNARLARFLENHDEARSQPTFDPQLSAAATITYTLPGMRFFFDGQLDGAAVHSPVQLGSWAEETGRDDVRELYRRLLMTIGLDVFHEGNWRVLDLHTAGDSTFEDLVATEWHHGEARAVVVANISASDAQGLVQLGTLPAGDTFDFVDQLDDRKYRWSRGDLDDGLYVRLSSGAAHLFLMEPLP